LHDEVFRYLVTHDARRKLFCNVQTKQRSVPIYTMNEPYILVFDFPHDFDNTLNMSGVPKAATIFYHENRWRFELKTGQARDDELKQRISNFAKLRQPSNPLDIASGPFGKKFPPSSYVF
jgi:hypothetical protein